MPDITIKNEPLSPPPQEYECHGRGGGGLHQAGLLTPKVEPGTSSYSTSSSSCRNSQGDGVVRNRDSHTEQNQQTSVHPHPQRSTSSSARTCSNNNNTTTTTQVPSQLRHQQRFLDAIQNGSLAELEHLLDVGDLNVNGYDAEGQTAVHRCCCNGNLDIVKLLARYGADLRLCNRDGWSALHLACWSGNQNIVMYLLNALKTHPK